MKCTAKVTLIVLRFSQVVSEDQLTYTFLSKIDCINTVDE